MPYDEGLAQRLREALADYPEVREKKMFGGLTFLLRGNMCVGVEGEDLMVRVGPEAYEDALTQPHAREMDFTGRPLKGFVYVTAAGVESEQDLAAWVDRGTRFALTLKAK